MEATPSRNHVIGVVGFYVVAAILMVTVNKWVLISTQVPLFFLWCQLVIAVVLLAISNYTRLIKLPHWDRAVARKLWPMVLVNVLGLAFNNYCLQYVDASFYQVARGLVLPMTVVLAFASGQQPPSPSALACCILVTCGFFVGVIFDDRGLPDTRGTSYVGVIFGLLSSCTTAVHSVVIKRSLGAVNGSTVDLAWYSNALSALVIFPGVFLVGEGGSIVSMLENPGQLQTFLIGTLITGVFGFMICVAGFLSIKVTSPVTHMVSSAARGVIQTVLAVWLFGDIIQHGRLSSILIIMLGSCAYVWVKHKESEKPKDSSATELLLAEEPFPEDKSSVRKELV